MKLKAPVLCYGRATSLGVLDYRKRVRLMTYLIDTWYVEYPDGSLKPCHNLKTAEYLVTNTDAIKVVDVTRLEMSK